MKINTGQIMLDKLQQMRGAGKYTRVALARNYARRQSLEIFRYRPLEPPVTLVLAPTPNTRLGQVYVT